MRTETSLVCADALREIKILHFFNLFCRGIERRTLVSEHGSCEAEGLSTHSRLLADGQNFGYVEAVEIWPCI